MFRYIILACFVTPTILTVLADECRPDEWQCKDGSCIPIDGKCDGRTDCRDRSDETHFLCRDNFCPLYTFRCTYGACVDGTAPCNGVEECADGSDELLPRCRNATLVVDGFFTCDNGEQILAEGLCDGEINCPDASDEKLESCAGRRCAPWLFQCAYGACVNGDAKCDADGLNHCYDGSDETDEICGRSGPSEYHLNYCVLPEYPEHGTYSVPGWPGARPGQSFADVVLTYTCDAPFKPDPLGAPVCSIGQWEGGIPGCKLYCELPPDSSVTYYCGDRVCNELELSGTEVFPQCKDNYYYNGKLRHMTCDGTSWDRVVTCESVPKNNCTTSIDNVKVQIQDNDAIMVIINDNVYMYVTGSHYKINLGNATTVTSGKGIEIAKVDNKPNTISEDDISMNVVKDEHPVSADGNINSTETTDTSISSDDLRTGNDNTTVANEPNLSVNVSKDEDQVTPSDSNPNVTETTVSSSPSDDKASGNDTINVIDEVNVQNGTTTPAPNQSTTEMPTISYSTDKLPGKATKKEISKGNKPKASKFFHWQYVMPRRRA